MSKLPGVTLLITLVLAPEMAADSSTSAWVRSFYPPVPFADWFDAAEDVVAANDGGYLAVGSSGSASEYLNHNAWYMKFTSSGSLSWGYSIGEDGVYESLSAAIQTLDGGYILAGDPDWVIKTDLNGTVIWHKRYSVSNAIETDIWSICQAGDGSLYAVGGDEYSLGWFMKLTDQGELIWRKTVNTGIELHFEKVRATMDGGCVIIGHEADGYHTLILKLTSGGDLQWQKRFDPPSDQYRLRGLDIRQTSDAGFVIGGDFDNTWVQHGAWCARLNGSGKIVWARWIDCDRWAQATFRNVIQTTGGNYIVVGNAEPDDIAYDGDDAWIANFNKSGALQWQKLYRLKTSEDDAFFKVQETRDRGFVLVGRSDSVFWNTGTQQTAALIYNLKSDGSLGAPSTKIHSDKSDFFARSMKVKVVASNVALMASPVSVVPVTASRTTYRPLIKRWYP